MGSGPNLSAFVEALPHLWFFALRLTSTSAAAERLVKDAYLSLNSRRHVPAAHVSARVNMIATILKLWRKSQMAAGFARTAAMHVETDCDMSRRLLQIIDTLPEDDRIAIILVEAEQLSLTEAAWVLGVTVAVLEQRIERANTVVSIAFDSDERSKPASYATRFAQLSKSERVRA
jgi:RNA polymerase sigma-70 factor, ECF subfamily